MNPSALHPHSGSQPLPAGDTARKLATEPIVPHPSFLQRFSTTRATPHTEMSTWQFDRGFLRTLWATRALRPSIPQEISVLRPGAEFSAGDGHTVRATIQAVALRTVGQCEITSKTSSSRQSAMLARWVAVRLANTLMFCSVPSKRSRCSILDCRMMRRKVERSMHHSRPSDSACIMQALVVQVTRIRREVWMTFGRRSPNAFESLRKCGDQLFRVFNEMMPFNPTNPPFSPLSSIFRFIHHMRKPGKIDL